MKRHKDILTENSLQKAEEALSDAKYALADDRLHTAQNRIYYAIFYSVISLGYADDFITSKHGQLIGWFNKKFIHEDKIFDKEMYTIYKTAYENRMKSDYEFTYKPVKEKVTNSFKDAEKFAEEVKKYLNPKRISE